MDNKKTSELASDDAGTLTNAPSVTTFEAPTLPGIDARDGTFNTRPLSELGNALRLLDMHKGNIHYIYDSKAWLHWLDGAWHWDIDAAIVRSLAAQLPVQIYKEGCCYLHESSKFANWSRGSQKKKTIDASVAILKDMDDVRLSLSQLDADPFKVGLDHARQVLDLKTGFVQPAQQNDFITKSLNIGQLGDASKALRWLEFLDQVFGNDPELIDWLKRWCGYLLTGATTEHIFVFCYGSGANGKSVMADILRYILGDYARAISSSTLTEMKRHGGSATPDLAELIGSRLAICTETEDGAALAESLIKSLVSGDTMSVRKLYSGPVEFTPQFKLMMLGNHKPVIKGTDDGIWRRVRLIPFKRIFRPEERDPALLDKLKAEAPHILAWMVEGCLEWQQRKLIDIPTTIAQATNEYQSEQDLIGRWLFECCSRSPTSETSSIDVYNSYKSWCNDNGLEPANKINFGRRLSGFGFDSRRPGGKTIWIGLVVN